jgi:hypothetical protein
MRPIASMVFVAGLAFAALAGSGARPQPAEPLSAPAQPAAPAQPSTPPQPQPMPYPTTAAAPECEAASLAWLVGKPRSAIPVPVYPSLRRVYCSTCLVTQDYMPGRTDIVFDTETGVITAVKCG